MGCFRTKSCSHNVDLDSGVLNNDVDVEDICISCVLSSSLPGIDAPGAFAKDVHQGEKSPDQPLYADDDGVDDDDDNEYKHNDDPDLMFP